MRDGLKRLPSLALGEHTHFPRVVEIQTTTVCNAKCCVCPYESTYGATTGKRMSDELLWKILHECKKNRDHLSQIVPYHNNEPTTDRRLIEILSYISGEIGVPIELSTNASLIKNRERAYAIVKAMGTGTLRVSFFGATKETYERRMVGLKWEPVVYNLDQLVSAVTEFEGSVQLEIVMVAGAGLTEYEIDLARARWGAQNVSVVVFGFLDRVGNHKVKNLLPRFHTRAKIRGCDLNRPFERMNIAHDGRALLCSQDWTGALVLGDANSSSLFEIWNSPRYVEARRKISGDILAEPSFLCRTCKLAIFH